MMMTLKWRVAATMAALALGLMFWTGAGLAAGTGPKPRAAVVVAFENYNIVAYQEMNKALQESGIPFDMASTQPGRAKSGTHRVKIDLPLSDLDLHRYAAIVFLGGFGVMDNLVDNLDAMESIKQAAAKGMVVGGSWQSKTLVLRSGVTPYEKHAGSGVNVDGRIVTVTGLAHFEAFSNKIVDLLVQK